MKTHIVAETIVYDTIFVATAFKAVGLELHTGDEDRSVCITPYLGAYGIAGYVCTIEGSPPRATFLLDTSSGGRPLTGWSIFSPTRRIATEHKGSKAMRWLRGCLIQITSDMARDEVG